MVREGRRTGQLQVRLVTSPGKLDVDALIAAVDCEGLWWTQTENMGESTYGGETALLSGAPQLVERLGASTSSSRPRRSSRRTPRWPSGSTAWRVEYAGLRGHENVFDLYCGIGTIGLSLATRARRVIGVEIVEAAVADAIENARINEIENAASTPATSAWRCASWSSARAARTSWSSTRRAPGLSQKVVRRIVEAGAVADRVRVVQPDDAGPERRAARRGGLLAGAGPPGGHVPAHAAHRVRGAVRAGEALDERAPSTAGR